MKLPEQGELWAPAPGDLTKQALEDYRSGLEQLGITPPVLEGTEIEIRYATIDNLLQPIFYNQAIKADAADWQVAGRSDLDRISKGLGMPEIGASPSTGPATVSIVGSGSVSFPDGMEGRLATGQFVRVEGNHLGVTNGQDVRIVSVLEGTAANVPAGTKGKWTAPPINVATEFVIGEGGLKDGGDKEDTEEKRERIQLERISRPRAEVENWGFVAAIARESHAGVQASFVYPCLGGPASAKVVVTAKRNPATSSYSRAVSDSVLAEVTGKVKSQLLTFSEILVQTPVEAVTQVSLRVTAKPGKNIWMGTSWPMPSGSSPVVLNNVTNASRRLKIAKSDLAVNEPTFATSTYIAWWSTAKRKVVVARAIDIQDDVDPLYMRVNLETPLSVDGVSAAAGDVIFPAPVSAEAYCKAIDDIVYLMGPGENYGSVNPFNGNDSRGFRLPRPESLYPQNFDQTSCDTFRAQFPELGSVSIHQITNNGTPAVPVSRNTAPNIIALGKLGLYPV